MRLKHRIAVVAGGAAGIGRARRCAPRGRGVGLSGPRERPRGVRGV